MRLNICSAIFFTVIQIIQVDIPVSPIVRALFSTPAIWWRLILLIWRTFYISVRSSGRSIADKAGGKDDIHDDLNAAPPSCWKSDEDALMVSSVSEMIPTAVICFICVRDSFCVACRLSLPCHISNTSCTLAMQCILSFLCHSLHFRVIFCVHGIRWQVITCQ